MPRINNLKGGENNDFKPTPEMIKEYKKCIPTATERRNKGKLKLCPRGYCTAKHTFEVYPSAYANGYATQVCMGEQPDAEGNTEPDSVYLDRINKLKSNDNTEKVTKKTNPLKRWYKEQWVNLCEKGDGPGGYAVCGSGKGIDNPKKYPYCRAYYKLPGTTVVTAQELTKKEIEAMCKEKRSKEQGIDGKPTRIMLSKKTRERVKSQRKASQVGGASIPIPKDVKEAAETGNVMINAGFEGGTQTGWNRGLQLANDKSIDSKSLADMRTWFARHGPDAKNGGTSYPGYCQWLADGSPMDHGFSRYRGAVSWLIWGGDAAYLWLKSTKVRNIIEKEFPARKKSPKNNNLGC